MGKELNEASKSRLYGLTAIFCSLWLIQSIYDTIQAQQKVFTWLNIIFYLSLFLVIVYNVYSACKIKKAFKKDK